MGQYFRTNDHRELFGELLADLLETTGSEFGFIAEVLHDEHGQPFLSSWAVSNISWNDETARLYADWEHDGTLEFRNLDTLFGWVMRHREPLWTDDPAHHPAAGGIPEGHPPLVGFLGVPLLRDDELIGMYAVSGRVAGYDERLVELLSPLTVACTTLVDAFRTERARREAERLERQARREAEQANLALAEFLSGVSHELRTPMNPILGYAQLLERSLPEGPDRDMAARISSAGRQMLVLVEELLDVAGPQRSAAEAPRAPQSVVAVLEAQRERLASYCAERQVTVRVDGDPALVALVGDGVLDQVLGYVLDDAVRRVGRGATITALVASGPADGDPAAAGRADGPTAADPTADVVQVSVRGPVASDPSAGQRGAGGGAEAGEPPTAFGRLVALAVMRRTGGEVTFRDDGAELHVDLRFPRATLAARAPEPTGPPPGVGATG